MIAYLWLIPAALTVAWVLLMAKITHDGRGPDGAAELAFVMFGGGMIVLLFWIAWAICKLVF